MSTEALVNTGWVQPPQHITGLDHLAIQAPCIEIYGQLLPGITNVTDRARYYSFYAWLFYAFESRAWREETVFIEMLRKADCLFSLIAMTHAEEHEDKSIHSGGVVGMNTFQRHLGRLQDGESLRLSEFSHHESTSTRYFKNAFGGLGQYYFGTLTGLNILSGDSPREGLLVEEVGAKIARAFEKNVNASLFMEILVNDSVTLDELKKLSSFCPCQLRKDSEEKRLLVKLFREGSAAIHRNEHEADPEAKSRSASMAYMLLLIDYLNHSSPEHPFDVSAFRALAYTRSLSGESTFEPFREIESSWQVYSRNELASVALQGLFHCLLESADNADAKFSSARSLASWFWKIGPGRKVIEQYKDQSFTQSMSVLVRELSDFELWQEPKHEVFLAKEIESATRQKPSNINLIVKNSLLVIASLTSREENKVGYGAVRFPANYLQRYPLNLSSIMKLFHERLASIPLESALIDLTHKQLLENHQSVAYRKLRNQGQMTFRFVTGDQGLEVVKVPPAVFTSPRFRQALQIMEDLGLTDKESGKVAVTGNGREFIELVL
ncbi:hypothetical protein [Vibrio comitans]